MATTIRQTEGIASGATALMQRIEAYIAYRYTSRTIEWIVEGSGDWTPPLMPATITTFEVWNGTAWEAVILPAGPLGYCLPAVGPYRITGTVGGGTMPAAVIEAVNRIQAYLAAMPENTPGARSVSTTIPDVMQETIEREPVWIARAMQQSGAADLLRPYRRA
jgi:hypothetical protein